MIRKSILTALAATLLLTACGTEATNPVRNALGASLKQLFNRNKQPPLTTEVIRARLTPELRAQIGVPTLIAELPKLKVAALLVYAEQNAGHITWLAPDGTGLVTRQGMLMSTRGIGFDLMASAVDGPLAVITGKGTGTATRVQMYLDGEDQQVPLRMSCSYVRTKIRSGFEVSELCNTGDVTIQNRYWLNPKREIIKSEQWAGFRNGHVLLEGPYLP